LEQEHILVYGPEEMYKYMDSFTTLYLLNVTHTHTHTHIQYAYLFRVILHEVVYNQSKHTISQEHVISFVVLLRPRLRASAAWIKLKDL
jgi:hypothetical protein